MQNKSAPNTSTLRQRPNAVSDEKKFKKALRFIFKYGTESNKLNEEAVEACKRQGIDPDEILNKTAEDFAVQAKDQIVPPKNKH